MIWCELGWQKEKNRSVSFHSKVKSPSVQRFACVNGGSFGQTDCKIQSVLQFKKQLKFHRRCLSSSIIENVCDRNIIFNFVGLKSFLIIKKEQS